jgi:hypothetical protein
VKFEALHRRFLVAREDYSEKVGPQEIWSVADHWPLFAGTYELARHLAIVDLVRSTVGLPGDLVEFGTWRGATAMLLAKVVKIEDPWSPKVVHAFDSFEGLEEFHDHDRDAVDFRGWHRGSRDELRAMIRLHQLGEELVVHEGLIEQTLPDYLEQRPEWSLSFVYCDTDLYSSTRTVLEHVPGRIVPGGVLAFDEWNTERFPGEGVAINDRFEQLRETFDIELRRATPQPTLVLRKR